MKIYIGPYINWFGPYQLADLLQHLGVSEDRCHEIGEKLASTWVGTFLEWVHSKRDRCVKIKIDRYDTWNMDDTLTLIVLPMLKQLKETKHGSPHVEDSDVPEELRSTSAPPKENEWDIDDNHFKRWDWALDQMIWSFEQLSTDWEKQFHSGVSDTYFEPSGQVDDQGKPLTYEMKRGPKDTSKFDKDGYMAHSKRIDNGLRLFGTYYRALWD
jgi:hypothetical protein